MLQGLVVHISPYLETYPVEIEERELIGCVIAVVPRSDSACTGDSAVVVKVVSL